MGLYSIATAKDEAGKETFGQYTPTDAENDAAMNSILDEAGHEVAIMSDTVTRAEAYLEGLSTMIDMDKTVVGAGTETFNAAAQIYYGLAAQFVGSGTESELMDGGTEKKTSYYQSALVLARKAWVQVKKTIMKAIAKLIGFANFRTDKISKLKETIKNLDSTFDIDTDKVPEDTIVKLVQALPCIRVSLEKNTDMASFIKDFGENKTKAELVKSLEFKIGDEAVSTMWSKHIDEKIKKEDGVTYKLFHYTKRAKVLATNVKTGSITYTTIEYPENVYPELVKKYNLHDVKTLTTLVENLEKANKEFSKTVDLIFKTVDIAGKILTSTLEIFGSDIEKEDVKIDFKLLKAMYNLSPRLAFDEVLSLNGSINGSIKVIEINLSLGKKETIKT